VSSVPGIRRWTRPRPRPRLLSSSSANRLIDFGRVVHVQRRIGERDPWRDGRSGEQCREPTSSALRREYGLPSPRPPAPKVRRPTQRTSPGSRGLIATSKWSRRDAARPGGLGLTRALPGDQGRAATSEGRARANRRCTSDGTDSPSCAKSAATTYAECRRRVDRQTSYTSAVAVALLGAKLGEIIPNASVSCILLNIGVSVGPGLQRVTATTVDQLPLMVLARLRDQPSPPMTAVPGHPCG